MSDITTIDELDEMRAVAMFRDEYRMSPTSDDFIDMECFRVQAFAIREADERAGLSSEAVLALMRGEAVVGWQPIETAPTDGTRILIYVPGQIGGEPVQIAAWGDWDEGAHMWVTDQGEAFFTFRGWMPLPASPFAKREG